MEIWKDIKDYEGIYQVSNLGRIKSISRVKWNRFQFINVEEKILKTSIHKTGYINIQLSKNSVSKNFSLHRLIAECFIENPEKKPCINHINGKKEDNSIDNLEWSTYSENNLHARKSGLNKISMRQRESAKKLCSKIVLNLETGIFYDTIQAAAASYNVSGKKAYIFIKTKNNLKTV